jgi:hypothetical protein
VRLAAVARGAPPLSDALDNGDFPDSIDIDLWGAETGGVGGSRHSSF